MDDLNTFYEKIQMYLMKQDGICGELKLLTSRVTVENNFHIDGIRESMTDIFESYNIPIKKDASISDERCVQSYKYLLLNTNFENQERLAEDIVSGHLVDMCPPLSPYLFVQILWSLEYEEILIESLSHVPFDLCTEILNIIVKCINQLDLPRFSNTVHGLISAVYAKFFRSKHTGIQSSNVEESIQNLLLSFEEFLLMLTNPKLCYLEHDKDLRQGLMLKYLIGTTKRCLERKSKEIEDDIDLEKLYSVTFGREEFVICEDASIEDATSKLDQLLIKLLLNKIKEVDCNLYMSWVELKDDENGLISLQRSIGIECYCLMNFLSDNENLRENTHLIECLQQFATKTNPAKTSFKMRLQELCYALADGKPEPLNELYGRYKEWDRSIIDSLYADRSVIGEKGCLALLEYVNFLLTESTDKEYQQFTCEQAVRILLAQNVPDLYKIGLVYLMKYDGKGCTESWCTEEEFREYIVHNANLQNPATLKFALVYTLMAPRITFSVLLKMTIGHPRYANTMISPNDLLLMSPFMRIREANNQKFLINTLRTVCIEDAEWAHCKFVNFINVMINNRVINVDELTSNVFIPYLKKNDIWNMSNMESMLNEIKRLLGSSIGFANLKNLMIILAKRMSFSRKTFSGSICMPLLTGITFILKSFFTDDGFAESRKMIMPEVDAVMEPIDIFYLSMKNLRPCSRIIDLIENYERRCLVVLNRLKEDTKAAENLTSYFSHFTLLREDFARHLVIRMDPAEFIRFSRIPREEYYIALGWDEHSLNFQRLMIEVCCLFLEYPSIGSNDLFESLFYELSHDRDVNLGSKRSDEYELRMIENMELLEESIRHSPYADAFTDWFSHLNPKWRIRNLKDLFAQCFKICRTHDGYQEPREIPHSARVTRFYVAHQIISACMEMDANETTECIRKMNELFAPN